MSHARQNFVMPSSKQNPTGFLDIPPEIRIQIYSNVLDIATISTGQRRIPRLRVPAKEKLRLLLVNKIIFAEALPVFYKHHTVCARIDDHPQFQSFCFIPSYRRFDLLVNLEIVVHGNIYDLDTANSDIEISRHLRFVDEKCKYLQTLLLELRPTSFIAASTYQNPQWRHHLNKLAQQSTDLDSLVKLDELFRWNRPYVIDKNGKTVLAVKRIWQRLDRLTIVLPNEGDYGKVAFMLYFGEQFLQVVERDKMWWSNMTKMDRWTNEHTGRWVWLFRVDRSRKWTEWIRK